MSAAQILDGKVISTEVRNEVAKELKELQQKHPSFKPHLTIVQVSSPAATILSAMDFQRYHQYKHIYQILIAP